MIFCDFRRLGGIGAGCSGVGGGEAEEGRRGGRMEGWMGGLDYGGRMGGWEVGEHGEDGCEDARLGGWEDGCEDGMMGGWVGGWYACVQ